MWDLSIEKWDNSNRNSQYLLWSTNKMLKYLSYLNLVFAIAFVVILRSNKNYIDLAFLIPSILFNWLSLYQLIKNKLRFDKWHIYIGYFSIFLSIISTIITVKIIFGIFSNTSIYIGPSIYLFLARQLFDISIIFQFITAFKENKRILSHST